MLLRLKQSWPFALLLALSLIAFGYMAFDAVQELVRRWSTEEEYGHGWLVPLVSAYIFRRESDRLNRSGPSYAVILALFLMAVLLLLGMISGLFFLMQVSVVLMCVSVVLFWWGAHGVRVLWGALAFLLFAIPLPYMLESPITAGLQLNSSQLAVSLISSLGLPVYLAGNIIDLGILQLQVVEACSGLRYMYPLMSLGFLAAYFYQGPLFLRWWLFFSTVPIAVILNSLRIALVAWLASVAGVSASEGLLHDFEGLMLFAGCMLVLLAELWLLNALFRQKPLSQMFDAPTRNATENHHAEWPLEKLRGRLLTLFIVVLIAGAASAFYWIDNRKAQAITPTFLASFPIDWPHWQGVRVPMAAGTRDALAADDYLSVNFFNVQSEMPVNFFVSFYGSQRSGQSPHSPKVCIPGGGWSIESIDQRAAQGKAFNRVVIVRQNQRQLVHYWFVERGKVVTNEYEKKWLLLKDFLIHGRTDGALVRITTPLASEESLSQAEARLGQFMNTVAQKLELYLPAPP